MDFESSHDRARAKLVLSSTYGKTGTGRLIGVDRLTALVLEMRVAIEACAPVYTDTDSMSAA